MRPGVNGILLVFPIWANSQMILSPSPFKKNMIDILIWADQPNQKKVSDFKSSKNVPF